MENIAIWNEIKSNQCGLQQWCWTHLSRFHAMKSWNWKLINTLPASWSATENNDSVLTGSSCDHRLTQTHTSRQGIENTTPSTWTESSINFNIYFYLRFHTHVRLPVHMGSMGFPQTSKLFSIPSYPKSPTFHPSTAPATASARAQPLPGGD